MTPTKFNAPFLVAALSIATLPAAADAQLIAADSFNADVYEDPLFPGTQRLNVTGANGDGNGVVDPGWVDDGDGDPTAWVSGSGNLQWDAGAPGNLTLGSEVVSYDDDSTGKGRFLAVAAPAPVTDFRRAFRVLDDFDPVNTYYMSALLNPGSAFTAAEAKREHAVIGFTSAGWDETGFTNGGTPEGIPYGLMFGFHGEDADTNPAAADQIDLVVRARQSGGGEDFPLQDTVLLAGTSEDPLDNLTYLVMLKLEVNSGVNGEDRVTYWVNPTNLASESTATDTAAASGSFDTFAMDQNDRIDRLTVLASSYETRSMFFDELRLAGTFEDLRGDLVVSAILGDTNNDGVVNTLDIDPFVLALTNPAQYAIDFPDVDINAVADINEDGDINTLDIDPFVALLTGGAAAAPEPGAAVLVCCALALAPVCRRR